MTLVLTRSLSKVERDEHTGQAIQITWLQLVCAPGLTGTGRHTNTPYSFQVRERAGDPRGGGP